MLTITMEINSILRFSLTMIVIIPLLSQCVSVASCVDWRAHNVFFHSHAFTKELTINSHNQQFSCFKMNVHLFIYYLGVWPTWVRIKVWNNTNVLFDGSEPFCSIDAKNFTGFMIRRMSVLGDIWYLYGYCTDIWIYAGYN